MAHYRCSIKIGKTGTGAGHSSYIAREGQHEEKARDLEHNECGNMPEWARDNPGDFWSAADEKNGKPYREFELALPRELTPDQRLELAQDFCKEHLKDHAYQLAIHCGKARDGGDQPHAHIMFCDRQNDGIERDRETYFKRANKKNPERGGAEKAAHWNGKGRQDHLKEIRASWADLTNAALEKAGHDIQVDHRSYEAQGIDKTPTVHMGPIAAAMEQRGIQTERGELNRSIEAYNKVKEMDREQNTLEGERDTLKEQYKKDRAEIVQDGKERAEILKSYDPAEQLRADIEAKREDCKWLSEKVAEFGQRIQVEEAARNETLTKDRAELQAAREREREADIENSLSGEILSMTPAGRLVLQALKLLTALERAFTRQEREVKELQYIRDRQEYNERLQELRYGHGRLSNEMKEIEREYLKPAEKVKTMLEQGRVDNTLEGIAKGFKQAEQDIKAQEQRRQQQRGHSKDKGRGIER